MVRSVLDWDTSYGPERGASARRAACAGRGGSRLGSRSSRWPSRDRPSLARSRPRLATRKHGHRGPARAMESAVVPRAVLPDPGREPYDQRGRSRRLETTARRARPTGRIRRGRAPPDSGGRHYDGSSTNAARQTVVRPVGAHRIRSRACRRDRFAHGLGRHRPLVDRPSRGLRRRTGIRKGSQSQRHAVMGLVLPTRVSATSAAIVRASTGSQRPARQLYSPQHA
jgi:hypothetical protein